MPCVLTRKYGEVRYDPPHTGLASINYKSNTPSIGIREQATVFVGSVCFH